MPSIAARARLAAAACWLAAPVAAAPRHPGGPAPAPELETPARNEVRDCLALAVRRRDLRDDLTARLETWIETCGSTTRKTLTALAQDPDPDVARMARGYLNRGALPGSPRAGAATRVPADPVAARARRGADGRIRLAITAGPELHPWAFIQRAPAGAARLESAGPGATTWTPTGPDLRLAPARPLGADEGELVYFSGDSKRFLPVRIEPVQ